MAESPEEYLCSQVFRQIGRGQLKSQIAVKLPAMGLIPLAACYLGRRFDPWKGEIRVLNRSDARGHTFNYAAGFGTSPPSRRLA